MSCLSSALAVLPPSVWTSAKQKFPTTNMSTGGSAYFGSLLFCDPYLTTSNLSEACFVEVLEMLPFFLAYTILKPLKSKDF